MYNTAFFVTLSSSARNNIAFMSASATRLDLKRCVIIAVIKVYVVEMLIYVRFTFTINQYLQEFMSSCKLRYASVA